MSDDGSCRIDVPIVIQRKRSVGWIKVASTTADADGAFVVRLADRAGRYRAIAPEIGSSERICVRSISSTLRHRH